MPATRPGAQSPPGPGGRGPRGGTHGEVMAAGAVTEQVAARLGGAGLSRTAGGASWPVWGAKTPLPRDQQSWPWAYAPRWRSCPKWMKTCFYEKQTQLCGERLWSFSSRLDRE